jgi:hypothetical protein
VVDACPPRRDYRARTMGRVASWSKHWYADDEAFATSRGMGEHGRVAPNAAGELGNAVLDRVRSGARGPQPRLGDDTRKRQPAQSLRSVHRRPNGGCSAVAVPSLPLSRPRCTPKAVRRPRRARSAARSDRVGWPDSACVPSLVRAEPGSGPRAAAGVRVPNLVQVRLTWFRSSRRSEPGSGPPVPRRSRGPPNLVQVLSSFGTWFRSAGPARASRR